MIDLENTRLNEYTPYEFSYQMSLQIIGSYYGIFIYFSSLEASICKFLVGITLIALSFLTILYSNYRENITLEIAVSKGA